MTERFTIYGASDDLVEVEGYFNNEFDALHGCLLSFLAPTGHELHINATFCKGDSLGWVLEALPGGLGDEWPWGIVRTHRPEPYGEDEMWIVECPNGTELYAAEGDSS